MRNAIQCAFWLLVFLLGLAGSPVLAENAFGWNPVPEDAAKLAAEVNQLYGREVDFLVQQSDDRDCLNYRWLAKALGIPRYTCVNQGNAGTCVGAGTCQSLSIVYAIEILFRQEPEKWVAPFSIEAVYAIGRQVAGQLGSWDGSTGAWSCRGISELGTCVMVPIEDHDLSTYKPQRAQQWARVGVPVAILQAAKPHRVRAIARVESTDQARAFLQNGNMILTCSRESYVSTRDSMGFARNDGRNSWPHAMAIVAYRGAASGKKGWLVLNSWGADWISGPVWPDDQPLGSFWITESDLLEHLRAGDTWAIGDIEGFPMKLLKLRDAIDVGGPIFNPEGGSDNVSLPVYYDLRFVLRGGLPATLPHAARGAGTSRHFSLAP